MNALETLLHQRIVIIDGAMGTMIQAYGLDETAFRGERFADHPRPLQGCNDLLCLTQGDLIREIHQRFFAAGADIIETNTFSAQTISLADYGLEAEAFAINEAAARLAGEAVRAQRTIDGRPRFVAGSIGPTNRTASISPDVNDPAFRAATFDDFASAYKEQVRGLLAGGVDLLLVETAFDTLNAKAALFAIDQAFIERGASLPVIASVAITDAAGRNLSGQTAEAFWVSVAHANPLAVGINCSLGAEEMRPHVAALHRTSERYLACYPNAGLPNEFGQYDQTPEEMAAIIAEFAAEGWLNLVGGCCGTTPEHIAAIANAVDGATARALPERRHRSVYSGLESFTIRPETNLAVIGERTNIMGSRKFARLIREQRFEDALAVARDQVEGGANILDVNMDEALIDSEAAMTTFLNLVASEPDVARLPIMIDSSKFSVIEAGLKCLQGKGIVNSISLKEGEAVFAAQASTVRRYGAALVVMAFDEQGQATTLERKVEICTRAHAILTEQLGFAEEDIIFDPNVLTVGTGIEEHNGYAVAFIEAVRELKRRFPRARTSGGVSNVSFSFRGNNRVREAMHAAFLYHAVAAGLDMAIVNAGQLEVYEEIAPPLLDRVEDVLLDRRPDATERLIAYAETIGKKGKRRTVDLSWREASVDDRLKHALIKGVVDHIEADLAEALEAKMPALAIIEGPLMRGMNVVGDRFGAGKMFLPQVVKSARAMKKAVAFLQPFMEQGQGESQAAARIVMATVKGDVHDIGKNIVGVVLACNNYRVIDLGVMVPARAIVDAALEHHADVIGLSGLITPSLDEMVIVASELDRRDVTLPLLIGGATTSRKHTAVKVAPAYRGPTVHVLDASRAVAVVSALLGKEQRASFVEENSAAQERARLAHQRSGRTPLQSYASARELRPRLSFSGEAKPCVPERLGPQTVEVPLHELVELIDWTPLFQAWELRGVYPAILDDPRRGRAARELLESAQTLLGEIVEGAQLQARAVYGFFRANADGDDIVLFSDEARQLELARFCMLRQQRKKQRADTPHRSLSDFIAPRGVASDYLGLFACSAGFGLEAMVARFDADHDDYRSILAKALADRLAEALAEYLHARARRAWGYGKDEALRPQDLIAERYRGIRPAPGYPACPDHSEKRTLFDLLEVEARIGVTLTESFAMLPAAAVSGLYFSHPDSRYFAVGPVGRDQIESLAQRRGVDVARLERWLGAILGYEPGARA